MKRINCIIGLFLLCTACNPTGNSGESNSKDANSISDPASTNELVNGPKLLTDSLLKDTFLLSPGFIVSNVLPINDEKEGNYEINAVLMLDSLKRKNKLNEYLAKLDVGQTKEATAFVYDTIGFGKAKVVVWGINYGTYEACPFMNGKSVFLTSFVSEKPVATQRIMAISSSADAPLYQDVNSWCKLESSRLISCIDSVKSGGDMVSEGEKEFEESVSYTISKKWELSEDGSIKEVENKKSPEKKERKLVEVEFD
jgi:hypothetical protein